MPFCPCFGNGVAVGPEGQIYVDTDHGDAVPNQELLEVLPSGRVLWLWAAAADLSGLIQPDPRDST